MKKNCLKIISCSLFVVSFNVQAKPKKELPPVVIEKLGDVKVLLKDRYAVMLINDKAHTGLSDPRYVYANLNDRKVISTKNINEFKKALSTIPKDAVIYRYDTVTVPLTYELEKQAFDAFDNIFKELKLKVPTKSRYFHYQKKFLKADNIAIECK